MSEGLPKTQGEDVDANNNAGGSEWDILSDMPDFSDFNDDDIEWDFDSSKDEKEPSHNSLLEPIVPFKGQLEALEGSHVERTAEEKEKKEGGVVDWEKIKDVFNDERYEILGHGTSSAERADSILAEGLHVGDTTGYMPRDTDIFANFMPLGNNDPDTMRGAMENWPHRDSKQIVLYRIPWQYKSAPGSSVAAYVPFYTGDSKAGTYDKEYAYGWYDAENGTMHLNPDYHGDLDNEKDVAYLEREKERIEKYLD